MKKKLFALAVLAICSAIAASSTLAYFTAEGTAHNVITTGGVGIEIVEKHDHDGDATTALVDFPENGVSGVMPGASVSKIVSVKNNGASEAWIRAKVDMNIYKAGSDTEVLPTTVITLDVNNEKWVYNEADKYYYYKESVPVYNEKTGAGVTDTLFENVHFAKEMGNEYQGCKILIDVSAQAVQTDNNPIPAGGNVTDIKGWPETT